MFEAAYPVAGRATSEGEAPAPVTGGLAAELRDVVAHLRRRRGSILLAAAVAAVLGIGVAAVLPRLYTATTQLIVDPSGLKIFDNQVAPGGQPPDVQSTLVETQARVLRSDEVLRPVVEAEHLAEDPEFDGGPKNPIAAALQRVKALLPSSATPDPEAVALAGLADATKVQRVPGSLVMELSVSSKDAEKAARLARAITESYVDAVQRSREEAAQHVSGELSGRLAALGDEVKRAETAVDDFRRQNGIVDATGQPINEQQLSDLTKQLVAARVRTTELRARLEQVQGLQRSGGVPDATSDTVQSPAILQLRGRYAELASQRDNLLTSLGPRHPSLQAANAQLDGVRRLIGQEVARIAASVRSDYGRARDTEQSLAKQAAAATAATGTVNTATIRLRELQREAQARRAVYESFLARSRETRAQGDLPNINISVISEATVPLKKSGLPAPLVAVVVALFGASAAALGFLALDHLRGRLATPRQLSMASGLPMLAAVPRLGREGAHGQAAGDLALLDLAQALSEAAAGPRPQTVLLLSGDRRAAATSLPLDLARALGGAGHRTVLVDSWNDRLTRPFDSGAGAGRRDWSPVRRTPLPNLSVVAWSEPFLQVSAQEKDIPALRQVSRDQDVVVMHALASDAAARLRRLADASSNIVLVVDADSASIAELEEMRRKVGVAGGKVDGFVWVCRDRRGALRAGGASAGPVRTPPPPVPDLRSDAA